MRAIHGEMDRISQALTQRVKELAERYETPLPQMVDRVAELEAKVNRHLKRMGFVMEMLKARRLQADRGGGDPGGLGGRKHLPKFRHETVVERNNKRST